jgi:hypothetical protein
MLRLLPEDSDMMAGFQSMHPAAKAAGFGRLFRSPTLWEVRPLPAQSQDLSKQIRLIQLVMYLKKWMPNLRK